MKLAIAETGQPSEELKARFGSYPEMMARMLARHFPEAETETFAVAAGRDAPLPEEADGLLITGSPAGVYEEHEWISPLEEAIKDWAASDKPVVGICFGHQILTQALGGRVEKSSKGWGVGVHTYNVVMPDLLGLEAARLSCAVSHQDQVTELPEGATRVAGSAFCPNGIIRYGQGRVLSFQMHPEFEHDFAHNLLMSRADSMPQETVELGRATYSAPSDRDLLAAAIVTFFKGE